MALKIGALAEMTGTNAATIRYYEQIGLLRQSDRGAGCHRTYDEDVKRLTFIRRCRDFGFPIDQIRTVAALMGDLGLHCTEAHDLAQDCWTPSAPSSLN